MFWYVLMGFLAAFGALCALWVLFGLLFHAPIRCHLAVTCPKNGEITVIRRFCRFRELGMIHSDLTVLNSELNARQQHAIRKKFPYIRFMNRQSWLSEYAEEDASRAGTGDLTGNHRSGGVSEL